MDPLRIDPKLVEKITQRLEERNCRLSPQEVSSAIELIEEEVIYHYVDHLINQVEAILDINPFFTERDILQAVAKNIVQYFDAKAATIRIYDPDKGELLSFGSFPPSLEDREETIPFEDTIAGEVVKTRRSYFVPNILTEEKYRTRIKCTSRESIRCLPFRSLSPVSLSRTLTRRPSFRSIMGKRIGR